MKKKLGLVLATFIFLIANLSIPAQADLLITDEIPEIPVILPEEDPDNPSARQDMGGPNGAKELTPEQMEEQANMVEEPFILRTIIPYSGWLSLDGYQVFGQDERNYCGPAAVQAVLTYINGSSPNQDSIAAGCGTDYTGTKLVTMKNYVNGRQSMRNYVVQGGLNQSQMSGRMYDDITYYDVPSIIGLTFDKNSYWKYSTGGHFVSIYGVNSTQTYFLLADPWIQYAGSLGEDLEDLENLGTLGYYEQPTGVLYQAYARQNLGLMY